MITLLNDRFEDNENGAAIHFQYNGEKINTKTRWVDKSTGLSFLFTNWELHDNCMYWLGIPYNLSKHLSETQIIFEDNLGVFDIKLKGRASDTIFCGNKHEISCLENDTPFNTFYEVKLCEVYNSTNVKVLPNDIVLDIGANYGFFSLYSIERGANKVYSFEPYKPVYDCLLKNTSKYPKILAINKAVSEFDGYSEFISTDTTGCNYINGVYASEQNTNGVLNVETININTLFDEYSIDTIDFAKIDCEGSELDIFLNISDENLHKIKKMVVEYHTQSIGQYILSKLVKNGFNIESSNEISNDLGLIYAYKKN